MNHDWIDDVTHAWIKHSCNKFSHPLTSASLSIHIQNTTAIAGTVVAANDIDAHF